MSLIADLIRAGVDPDLVGRVADEIAKARAEGAASVARPIPAPSPEYRLDVSLPAWRELRLLVLKRDGPDCRYCGETTGSDWCCDHIVPLARGGRSVMNNLAVSCRSCNAAKKDRLLSEWRVGDGY